MLLVLSFPFLHVLSDSFFFIFPCLRLICFCLLLCQLFILFLFPESDNSWITVVGIVHQLSDSLCLICLLFFSLSLIDFINLPSFPFVSSLLLVLLIKITEFSPTVEVIPEAVKFIHLLSGTFI